MRTERVWQHFDAAFAEADKAFAEADRIFKNTPPNGTQRMKTGGVHQLHFQARSAGERWRLTKKFIKMAFGVLFTGKANLSFKDR
jgi:hypothetical protein